MNSDNSNVSQNSNVTTSAPIEDNSTQPVQSVQSVQSTQPASAQTQFATALKYYETVKNTLASFLSNFMTNSNNKFYLRMAVAFGTVLLFLFNFVSTMMLNYIYFFNNIINSVKAIAGEYPFATQIHVIDSWITFGSVVVLTKLVNSVSTSVPFWLVRFVCEVAKCAMYYKLMSDPTVADKINSFIRSIYLNNKWGINQVQDYGVIAVNVVNDAFGEDSRAELMASIRKLKTN